MSRYYVNDIAQASGDHEVHRYDCSYLPKPENRTYLGDFSTCSPAIQEAKKHYRQCNGCYWCAKACHTG